jgi:hypothetical protein
MVMGKESTAIDKTKVTFKKHLKALSRVEIPHLESMICATTDQRHGRRRHATAEYVIGVSREL